MAYGGNPSGVPRDAVRLLVGDISTSTASEILSNSDYDFFLAQTPNKYEAAALAVQSLANVAAQGGVIRKEVGDLVLVWDFSQLMALARRFTLMSSLQCTPTAGGIEGPNGQLLKPAMFRKLMDNPEVIDPLWGRSTSMITTTG